MNTDPVRAIADAILYEGYMLYPYRPSALKNRQRWTFGAIFPQCAAVRRHGDNSQLFAECLVAACGSAEITIGFRFLHVMTCSQSGAVWEEAVAREVSTPAIAVGNLLQAPAGIPFAFGPAENAGNSVTRMMRNVTGLLTVTAEPIAGSLVKIRLRAENTSDIPEPDGSDRARAQKFAFASAHALLSINAGKFVSLLDPPEQHRAAVEACRNQGWWPVLAGDQDARDRMLVSPIILYDYPAIAPESPGDLFDGGEIDEILTLRILTLTDAEKREIAASDPRVAALLARTEELAPEQLLNLHGTFRSPPAFPKPVLASLRDGITEIRIGARVRLNPRPGGDIFDLALAGKTATVEAIERDFEDRIHVAVTIDDDPGRDLGLGRFPGHRFFFSREEIEPVEPGRHP